LRVLKGGSDGLLSVREAAEQLAVAREQLELGL